jgi:Na+/pantothenate symporter
MKSELKMLAIWAVAVLLLLVIGGMAAAVTRDVIAGLVIAVIAVALAGVANYDGLKEWATR